MDYEAGSEGVEDGATSLLVPTTPLRSALTPSASAKVDHHQHRPQGYDDELLDDEGRQRSGLRSNLPSMGMGKAGGVHITGSANATAAAMYSQCPQVTIQNIVATCNLGNNL